jgi:hypothetical protein
LPKKRILSPWILIRKRKMGFAFAEESEENWVYGFRICIRAENQHVDDQNDEFAVFSS